MEVNKVIIQPEAWDFNKAKLSDPAKQDGKASGDKPVDKSTQDGTLVTLSARGLALSRSRELPPIPDIGAKIDRSDSTAPNTGQNAESQKTAIEDVKKNKIEFNIKPSKEKQEIDSMRLRDMQVRAKNQAHLASAGKYSTGGVKYDYVKGPDGRSYATNGEVKISIPEGNSPEENLRIAIQVERAASFSSEPIQSDRLVSSAARRMAVEILGDAIKRGSVDIEADDSNPIEPSNSNKPEDNVINPGDKGGENQDTPKSVEDSSTPAIS